MGLSNAQYNVIMRQYEEKQLNNQHIVSMRKKMVYAEIPRLQELDDSISATSISQAKKLIEGDLSAISDLKTFLDQLILEKKELLNSNGYPDDYFEPPYECKVCKDTGYIKNEKCHCFKQAAINLIYTQYNIKRILEKENFQKFSFDFYSDTLINPTTNLSSLETVKQAVCVCKKFVQNFDHSFDNLFFCGDTGTGKTFLSNCVAKELLDEGHSVIYFTALEIFQIFEKKVFSKDMAAGEDFENIFNCDLLIIDDLGTEFSNSFTTSQLFQCLNERILRRKSSIISTNLSLKQLATIYSERTFSRISSNYTIIKLFGDDIRILKKLK